MGLIGDGLAKVGIDIQSNPITDTLGVSNKPAPKAPTAPVKPQARFRTLAVQKTRTETRKRRWATKVQRTESFGSRYSRWPSTAGADSSWDKWEQENLESERVIFDARGRYTRVTIEKMESNEKTSGLFEPNSRITISRTRRPPATPMPKAKTWTENVMHVEEYTVKVGYTDYQKVQTSPSASQNAQYERELRKYRLTKESVRRNKRKSTVKSTIIAGAAAPLTVAAATTVAVIEKGPGIISSGLDAAAGFISSPFNDLLHSGIGLPGLKASLPAGISVNVGTLSIPTPISRLPQKMSQVGAAPWLRPAPSVKLISTVKKFSRISPPAIPDTPSKSDADEFVMESNGSMMTVLKESSISTYRPEVLSEMEFLPIYDSTGAPNLMEDFIDLRYLVQQMKVENVADGLALFNSSDPGGSFSALQANYSQEVREVDEILRALTVAINTIWLAKRRLDIKDNSGYIASQADMVIESAGIDSEIEADDLRFQNIMMQDLDFSKDGYKKFCNTKVLGQILLDFRKAILRHSYSLISDENPARQDDEDSVKYNRDYYSPSKRVRTSPWSLKNDKFNPGEYGDYKKFLKTLPRSRNDRIKLLTVMLSRELTVSAGIGYLNDGERELGKRFNVTTSPMDSSIGKIGRDILSTSGPEGSLADFMIIQDAKGNNILPFETRSFRDSKNRTFLPGGLVFIDSLLRGRGYISDYELFRTEPFSDFAKNFTNVSSDVGKFWTEMLDLDLDEDPKRDKSTSVESSSIYKAVLNELLEDIRQVTSIRNFNREQAMALTLMRMGGRSSRLRHLILKYLDELSDSIDELTAREESDNRRRELKAKITKAEGDLLALARTRDMLAAAARSSMNPNLDFRGPSPALINDISAAENEVESLKGLLRSMDITLHPGPSVASNVALPLGTSGQRSNVYSTALRLGTGTPMVPQAIGTSTLMVRTSLNPLVSSAKAIVREVSRINSRDAEKGLTAPPTWAGQYTTKIDLESLYSMLKGLNSTHRRSENVLLGVIDLTKELESRAQMTAKRDSTDDASYLRNGLTYWHRWAPETLMMIIFEIMSLLVAKYASGRIMPDGAGSVLTINLPVNERLRGALQEVLDISTAPERITRNISIADRMVKRTQSIIKQDPRDRSPATITPSNSAINKAILRSGGLLSPGLAAKMYSGDEDENATTSDLSDMYEALIDDTEFLRKVIGLIGGVSRSVKSASVILERLFNQPTTGKLSQSGHNPSIGVLHKLKKSEFGKSILSTLGTEQLLLLRSLRVRLTSPSQGDGASSMLPARVIIDDDDMDAFKVILRDPKLGGHVAANIRVLSVGIPTGMMSALTNPPYIMGSGESTEDQDFRNLIEVSVYRRDLEYNDLVFEPKKLLFDMSIFIMPGAFKEVKNPANSSFDRIARKGVSYTQVWATAIKGNYTGDELIKSKPYGDENNESVKAVLSNHLMDHTLRKYYEMLFGVDIDESIFFANDRFNELTLDPDGLAALHLADNSRKIGNFIVTGRWASIDQLTEGSRLYGEKIVTVATIDDVKDQTVPSVKPDVMYTPWGNLKQWRAPKLSENQLNSFRAMCSSNLFGPTTMKRRILAPRVFDRVFMIPIDPDTFNIDIDATMETEAGKLSYESKLVKDATEVIMDENGDLQTRLKPRPKGQSVMAFDEFFVTISTVKRGG